MYNEDKYLRQRNELIKAYEEAKKKEQMQDRFQLSSERNANEVQGYNGNLNGNGNFRAVKDTTSDIIRGSVPSLGYVSPIQRKTTGISMLPKSAYVHNETKKMLNFDDAVQDYKGKVNGLYDLMSDTRYNTSAKVRPGSRVFAVEQHAIDGVPNYKHINVGMKPSIKKRSQNGIECPGNTA